ncbi:MAG: DegT/DnrJ/EryC1/StrS family aminotransferase [Nitrospirota bacterium]
MISLSEPDLSPLESEVAAEVLRSIRFGSGAMAEAFEDVFSDYAGREYAASVSSGTLALLLCLKGYGIGPGDEVVVSPFSWHQIVHAVSFVGAEAVFADIDYWTCTLDPAKAEQKITAKTKAILVGNTNGHPADWDAFRDLARRYDLRLIEDSTEAIGSLYKGTPVGRFGDCAIFSLCAPGPLATGGCAVVVTDDGDLDRAVRYGRSRRLEDRFSIVVTGTLSLDAGVNDLSAALGLAQLSRPDEILAQRKAVEAWYAREMKSFEGIKDPFVAPYATEVHWFLYMVHLGTRFSRSSRDAIIEDLLTEEVEGTAYCQLAHLQRFYVERGSRKGACAIAEKNGDRAIVLPFHGHLTEDQVVFIVKTLKDASLNVGAGSAIYL